jgi:hypothetical protein
MTYLIMIEAEGADQRTFHCQPYRTAASLHEARDLMGDYMLTAANRDLLCPTYFVLYTEHEGTFLTEPRYVDPDRLETVDATEWLARTGRV